MQRYLSYAASHDGGVGALDLTKSRDPGHLLEEVQLAPLEAEKLRKKNLSLLDKMQGSD